MTSSTVGQEGAVVTEKSNAVALCPHCGALLAWAAVEAHTPRQLRQIVGQWARRGDEVRYWTDNDFDEFKARSARPFGCVCRKQPAAAGAVRRGPRRQ